MKRGEKVSYILSITILMTFLASPVFARSISLKDAGIGVWTLIIIGAVIVLLQLIPAAVLFFSFIGTSTTMIFKRGGEAKESAAEEIGKNGVPGYEAASARK
jgi:hypothetical protein